jgi:uncharacterized protein
MKIPFDAIVEPGLNLEITNTEWFPDGDWDRVSPVQAKIFLIRKNRRVFLDGYLNFSCRFACDSCLEIYDEVQDFFFKVEFEYLALNDPYWQSEEHQCPQAEMDVEVLLQPEIDIHAILAQQVILSIPAKRLCVESCRGLCPSCGKNLNKDACLCQNQKQNSPFQILAQLKVK